MATLGEIDHYLRPLHRAHKAQSNRKGPKRDTLSPKETVVDHIDGNQRNNYRSNLRICTPEENARNRGKRAGATSRFNGVCWHRKAGKRYATIRFRKRHTGLGLFDDEVEAARAYDHAA